MIKWLKAFKNRTLVTWNKQGYAICPECKKKSFHQSFGIIFVRVECLNCKFTFIDFIRMENFS